QDKNVPASIFSFIQKKVFHHSENYYCTISFCLVPHCLVSGFFTKCWERKNKQMSYTGISVLPSPRKIMKKEGSGKFLFVFFSRWHASFGWASPLFCWAGLAWVEIKP
ncbi:MAG: hypothetical protein SPL48_06265, partial [Bacteroidales bacterium]|nr:hypothetical protein [Bacteroidales bacterium]